MNEKISVNLTKKKCVVFGGHSPIAIEISKLLSTSHTVFHFSRKIDKNLRLAFDDFEDVELREFKSNDSIKLIDHSCLISEPINTLIFAFKSDLRNHSNELSNYGTNVLFPYYYIRHLLEHKLFEQSASVIFFSSPAAELVLKDQPLIYHLIKSSINQLVRYLSVYYGEQLRVNAISPGSFVLKNRNKQFYSEKSKMGKKIRNFLPTKVIPTDKDIAHVVNFLASEEGKIFNGQNLKLNGGYLNLEISQWI